MGMKKNLLIIFHFNNLRKFPFPVFCAVVSFSDQYLQSKRFLDFPDLCLSESFILRFAFFMQLKMSSRKQLRQKKQHFFAKFKMLSIFDCFDFLFVLFVIYTLAAVMVRSNRSLTGCKIAECDFCSMPSC